MKLKWDQDCLLYSLRDHLKKLTAERDSFEGQLKNEKDERDLYKVGEISPQFLTEQVSFLQRANGDTLFLTLLCSCV